MIKLLIPLFWLFSSALVAQNITVQTLSNGACWLEKSENGAKVANFNQGNSFTVGGMEIGDSVEKIEQQFKQLYGIDYRPEKLQVFLHCGTYGASVVFRFIGKQNLCIWNSVQNGELKIGPLFAAHRGHNGFCDGIVPGMFLVKVKDATLFNQEIETTFWKERIAKVEILSGDIFKVYLHKQFHFQEDELYKQMEHLSSLSFVDFNGMNHPVGEFEQLYNFSLK